MIIKTTKEKLNENSWELVRDREWWGKGCVYEKHIGCDIRIKLINSPLHEDEYYVTYSSKCPDDLAIITNELKNLESK